MPTQKEKSGAAARGSFPLQNPVHEKFCTLVQSGIRPTTAALQCGLSKSSGNYLTGRPDVSQRMMWLKKDTVRKVQQAVVAKQTNASVQGTRQRRRVDINRNEIIMILADIARDNEVVASTRVNAALGLADIFMLRARSVRDLREFYGWTDDEIEEYLLNGGNDIPERLRSFVDRSQVPSIGEEANVRTDNGQAGRE